MKKLINIVLLIIFLSFIPICCYAVNDVGQLQVKAIRPAKVQFQDGDNVLTQEIEVGNKLHEPSHSIKEGYIFDGWYIENNKWDFDNDIVNDDLILIAKYISINNYNINIKVDENSIMQPSILNKVDLGAEFEGISPNDDLDIILEVKDAENIITANEKQKFENVFRQKGLILGKYIDISMFLELNHDITTKKAIHKTNNKVKVELTIPEDIRFKNKKYYLLRLHDNVVDTIYEGFPSKDWKLTVETDRFSLYAIAYSDENHINFNFINPITGDNIEFSIILFIVSIIGIIGLVFIKKRKAKNENTAN